MLDLYSKIVFSVIAVALVVIAWHGTGGTRAAAAFGEGCGSKYDPCYIKVDGPIGGLPVAIESLPAR